MRQKKSQQKMCTTSEQLKEKKRGKVSQGATQQRVEDRGQHNRGANGANQGSNSGASAKKIRLGYHGDNESVLTTLLKFLGVHLPS